MSDQNNDRAAESGSRPAGGHGRIPTNSNSSGWPLMYEHDTESDSPKPAPFGSLEMADYLCVEGLAGRIPKDDALCYVRAEIAQYRRIRDARAGQVTANSEGITSKNPASTSAKAAAKVAIKSGTQRAAVLAEICRSGGVTDYELSGRLRLLASSVRPRRVELITGGFVVDSGETRTHRGNAWTIWVATTAGMEWFRQEQGDVAA